MTFVYWSGTRYPRWLRTLSHPGAAITASSTLARLLTSGDLRTDSAEDRWKKFLSFISHAR